MLCSGDINQTVHDSHLKLVRVYVEINGQLSKFVLQVFFSVFNIVWTTLFLEVWKRNAATFAYKWGTIGTDDFEEARAAYHGELGRNKVPL